MSSKSIFYTLVLCILVAIAWNARNSEFVQNLTQQKPVSPPKIVFNNDPVPVRAAPDDRKIPMADAAGLKKCIKGSKVIYTDEPCPTETKALQVSRGTITVVGGTRASTPTNSSASTARSGLRDLAGLQDDVNFREKHMDKMIGQ